MLQDITSAPLADERPDPIPPLRLIKSEDPPSYDPAPGRRTVTGESPLLVLPTLACEVGLGEAVFLQQIHYWTTGGRGNERDGRRWVFNSYEEWHAQFPFWSVDAIGRMVRKLVGAGLIEVTTRYNASAIDQRRWYRLRYENPCLAGLVSHSAHSQNGHAESQIAPAESQNADANSQIVIGTETTGRDYRQRTSSSPPPPNGRKPEPVMTTGFRPTYATTLGPRYEPLRDHLRSRGREFNEGWLRHTLAELEREIGALPRPRLIEALGSATDDYEREAANPRRRQRNPIEDPGAWLKGAMRRRLLEQKALEEPL